MCLHRLDPKEETRQVKYGYKVFDKYRGWLRSEFFPDGDFIEYETWMVANSGKLLQAEISEEEYWSGFHVFTNKKDAFVWAQKGQVVKKVLVEGITCSGTQHYSGLYRKVVVCKRMKVLQETIKR